MPDQTQLGSSRRAQEEPPETCGEVGTSFPYGSHQKPMDTEPCALPYGHEEDHDCAQCEAAIRRALYDTLSPNFEIDAEAYNTAAVIISKLVGSASVPGSSRRTQKRPCFDCGRAEVDHVGGRCSAYRATESAR